MVPGCTKFRTHQEIQTSITRDRPIWLFLGRYRCIGHSWANISADTNISKIIKSCFLLHYKKYGVCYGVFYAVPFIRKLQKSGFMS